MTAPLTCTVGDDGVAVVEFQAPDGGTPTLTAETLAAARDAFDELTRRGDVLAVLVTSAGDGVFLAGADVKALRALMAVPEADQAVADLAARGQEVLLALERLTPPTVAVIDGACLGGGLEVALACRYRLATSRPAVTLGLPEVQLGLVPGLGGTQRLPRTIGLTRALEWMLTGRRVNTVQARRAGLVDAVLPDEAPLAAAREFALRRAAGRPLRRTRRRAPWWHRWAEGTAVGRSFIFGAAGRRAAKQHGHYPALAAIRTATQAGYDTPGPRGYAAEARAIGACAATPAARNLVDLFLTDRAAARRPPANGRPVPAVVERAAVLGAGLMGSGIAHWLAQAGLPVVLRDLTHFDCAQGLQRAAAIVRRAVRRRRLTPRAGRALLRRITPRTDWRGLAGTGCVIEAVVEDAAVKRDVLAEAEAAAGGDGRALIATNTSTIPIAELAGALQHPDRFCGLHFFNPVRRMRVVEVIAGAATSPQTLADAAGFVRAIGKTPIVVQDRPGFLVNRLLGPYLAEAAACIEEGAAPDQPDRVLEHFGQAMGPMAVIGAVGLGTARKAAAQLRAAFGERWAPSRLLDFLEPKQALVAGGRLNTGHLAAAAARAREARGCTLRGAVPDDEVRERCLLILVNEAAWALQEGVVASPAELDLAMVFATGFAPWSGGPCRWADATGLETVVTRLRHLADAHGERFTPAPYLTERRDHGFYG